MLDGLRRKLAVAEGFDATLSRWRLRSAEALASFLAELIEAAGTGGGAGTTSPGPARPGVAPWWGGSG
jgi:hypothetical protein